VGKVWPYVVAGIAVGAGIHGYVPENFMASIMGKGAWWSVPLAVLIGVPLVKGVFSTVLQEKSLSMQVSQQDGCSGSAR
jgi:uncharacterized membrane protein YraQ (UPF0718 family)